MEQRRADAHNLLKRVISALILIPFALGAIYYGHPVFDLLVLVGFIILLHEWVGLCGARQDILLAGIIYGTGGLSLIVVSLLGIVWGGAIFGAGFVAVLILSAGLRNRPRPAENAAVPAFGFFYLSGAVFFLLVLRGDPTVGLKLVLFLFLVSWASDTGAYVFGRLIGGPKMAPVLSPNKTWAGLFGGVLCGAGIGAGFAVILDTPALGVLIGAGTILGIVSQGGDLLESYMKRRFHVKDAGNLIPGHGGLLDRVDSLLALSWVSGLVYWLARDKVLLWM
ncbi:MAG: phosphatidate cytidylyltransferase [Rhodospirillales bacterium]